MTAIAAPRSAASPASNILFQNAISIDLPYASKTSHNAPTTVFICPPRYDSFPYAIPASAGATGFIAPVIFVNRSYNAISAIKFYF